MSELMESLQSALTASKEDNRLWIRKEIHGLIKRIQGRGVRIEISPEQLQEAENQNIGTYRGDSASRSIDLKKKRASVVAESSVKETLEKQAHQGIAEELMSMDPEGIKKHFKNLPEAKKFIKDQGGSIHKKASWDQTIAVLQGLWSDEEE